MHGGKFPDKGAFAEYAVVKAKLAYKVPEVPEGVPDGAAPTYGVGFTTAAMVSAARRLRCGSGCGMRVSSCGCGRSNGFVRGHNVRGMPGTRRVPCAYAARSCSAGREGGGAGKAGASRLCAKVPVSVRRAAGSC